MESTNSTPGFFARLKQHHLYQVALGYALVAGFIIQVGSRALPYFGWGNAMPVVIIALLAGFPVTLALTWMLVKPKDPTQYSSWQQLHWKLGTSITTAVIVLVVISAVYTWKLSARHARRLAMEQTLAQTAMKAVVPTFNPPADSLVVLPFRNLGGDPRQQYFSDGITEELTGALGQNPGLHVIAWETASRFHNSEADPGDIGRQLNVANILHGSILRQGNEVRITAELVDAVTGYEIWSHHYDGSFKDNFAVQDQVSKAIADALKVKFAQADLPTHGTTSTQAHELVLKGRAMLEKADAASLAAARADFEQAIALDPDYAAAHALLARILIGLTERSDLPLKTTLPRIRAEAQKALTLDPRDADAWIALALADANGDPPNFPKAQSEFRRALALDPSNAGAHLDYGNLLPLKKAWAEFNEAALLDPASEATWNNLASIAPDLDDWPQDLQAAETLLKLAPEDVDSAFFLANAYQHLRQYDKMGLAFDLVKPATLVDREQVAAGRLTYQAVQNSELRSQALAALKALSQHQSNTDVAGNLLQMYLALGETTSAQQLLGSLCPADPVFCNDLGINPMYRTLHSDPVFEQLAKKYTTLTLE